MQLLLRYHCKSVLIGFYSNLSTLYMLIHARFIVATLLTSMREARDASDINERSKTDETTFCDVSSSRAKKRRSLKVTVSLLSREV